MKYFTVAALVALGLTACASTETLLANEAGIAINVGNTAHDRKEGDAAREAQAHCEQFGKNAVLAGVDGKTGYQSGTYRFECVG